MTAIIIYITCSDRVEAEKISLALVNDRLVACANIFAPHASIYHWRGKVEQGEEVAVIFKTRADLFEKVKEKILSLHSYDAPCIISWKIENGHAPFMEWIGSETQAQA